MGQENGNVLKQVTAWAGFTNFKCHEYKLIALTQGSVSQNTLC
jgi:hypothetical protein